MPIQEFLVGRSTQEFFLSPYRPVYPGSLLNTQVYSRNFLHKKTSLMDYKKKAQARGHYRSLAVNQPPWFESVLITSFTHIITGKPTLLQLFVVCSMNRGNTTFGDAVSTHFMLLVS
ncbi:hypothetical protein L873DRAFT_1023113 [Choiromyces venosus 120613-1]|uniref:Uncharacterized protein n=1 Tax=Choiromyces venosus 120613-1 TaxID=1336337 RepID=A0A3N4IQW0_9PEZI|nr:hypothetical protein L873DRAFT_1023113 [Choiromyces venosus 120613-1]